MTKSSDLLAGAIDDSQGLILVVTGAGISSASGIPTFRGTDPDAVWNVSDVEMATRRYFEADPVGQWSWYLKRFEAVDRARPNPGHDALVDLERWHAGRGGHFVLVTQNIDTLHEEAGTRNLIKVHGTSDRLRCVGSGCENAAPRGSVVREQVDLDSFRAQPSDDTLPRCPSCGKLLRAHVLFFDEYYQEHDDYRFSEVTRAAEEASLVLFIGTSFSVGITEILLRAAYARRTPAFSIDPGGGRAPASYGVTTIEEAAEAVLPDTVRLLTG